MEKRPKSIIKEDIGHPFDFRHVAHVGWDNLRMRDIQEIIETGYGSSLFVSSQVPASSNSSGVRRKKVAPAPPQNSSQSADYSLSTAGVSHKQLEDEDTRNFIYDNNSEKEDQDVAKENLLIEGTGIRRKKVTRAPSQSLPESSDASLDTILEKAGVSQRQLEDEDTRKFIYDFLNKHGGWKVVGKAP
ncbi:hypothetical protein FQR65_LT01117 [Abscondita terminalis]|nr:hypothetical protein FQR65_LT01117 [Abscondita terminalis]